MGRKIIVRAVRKEQPNIGLYVQALIALARQLQAEAGQDRQTPAADTRKEADDASR